MSKADKKAKVTAGMYDVVVSPVITEKSQMGVEFNKVTFAVAAWATKPQVKVAVEALFETKVEKINIINVKGKVKRFRGTIGKRSGVKKAVVTLAEGQTIDVAATA